MAAKELNATVNVNINIEDIADLIAKITNVEIINREVFSQKVNGAIVGFIVPRLMLGQLERDGIVKKVEK